MSEVAIEVTLVTAIWREPRVFAGTFVVTPAPASTVGTRYAFRAEASDRSYRFTDLRRIGSPEPAPFVSTDPLPMELLTHALDETVALLHERELRRLAEGRGPTSTEPCSLEDLGFQVSFPVTPASPEVDRALDVLLHG